jgi:uncharacterized membrane protein YphA (DoxX/SURF4 family)
MVDFGILVLRVSPEFFLSQGEFEYTFIIAAVCLALVLLGPGKFSIINPT